jgi:8-oxo-dGTP pyrophosphatase MutT (NUDIX family)
MKKAGKKGGRTRAQIAAMPVRLGLDGVPEILLVTSRTTRRWIVPKGWRMKKRKDAEAAAIEAFEEAGVIGRVSETPAGRYSYWKRMADHFTLCEVTLYLLEVERQLDSWAEKDERRSQWFKLADAADLVDEPELRSAIRNLSLDGLARDAFNGPIAVPA